MTESRVRIAYTDPDKTGKPYGPVAHAGKYYLWDSPHGKHHIIYVDPKTLGRRALVTDEKAPPRSFVDVPESMLLDVLSVPSVLKGYEKLGGSRVNPFTQEAIALDLLDRQAQDAIKARDAALLQAAAFKAESEREAAAQKAEHEKTIAKLMDEIRTLKTGTVGVKPPNG